MIIAIERVPKPFKSNTVHKSSTGLIMEAFVVYGYAMILLTKK